MSPYTHGFRETARVSSLEPARPVRAIEREAHQLHELEREGESEWTPWIALLGLVLFFTPIAVLMMALTLAASYVAH